MIVSRTMFGNAFCSRFNDETMLVEITAVHGFDNNPIMPKPLELDAYDLRGFIETLQRLEKAISEALEQDVTSTLAAQGIKYVTPPSPKPSMEEEIEELYGPRCPDYEPNCVCCDMWHAYDVGAYACVSAELEEMAKVMDEPIDIEDDGACPRCGAVPGTPEYGTVGDGYNGLCPSCADKADLI